MIVFIVNYDYFIFEIASIRLGKQTCLKTFDFILILCVSFFHFGT
jgi:hypothetical protein